MALGNNNGLGMGIGGQLQNLPTINTDYSINYPQQQQQQPDYLGMNNTDEPGAFSWDNPNLMQNIGTGVKALGGLFGIYQGIQGMSLAKDQYRLQRDAYKTNLRNSTKAYNSQLQDLINGRAADADMSQEKRDNLIKSRQL